jgi:hypothetical protein
MNDTTILANLLLLLTIKTPSKNSSVLALWALALHWGQHRHNQTEYDNEGE